MSHKERERAIEHDYYHLKMYYNAASVKLSVDLFPVGHTTKFSSVCRIILDLDRRNSRTKEL